jgi:hypothetical protein
MSHSESLVLLGRLRPCIAVYTPAATRRKQQLFDRIAGKAKVWLDGRGLSDYRTATFQSCLLDCAPGFAGIGNSMAREKQE